MNAPTGEPPVTPPTPLARFGSWPAVIALLGASVVLGGLLSVPLMLAVMSAAGLGSPQELLDQPAVIFSAIVFEDVSLVGLVYVFLIRRRILSWTDMGLTGRRSSHHILHGLGWGVLFVFIAGVVENIQRAFGLQQTQADLFPLKDAGPWGRSAILLAGILLAPLAEEIFFRGYLFRAITERKGLVKGVLYSSALFGLIHVNVGAFLPIATASTVLALGYRRSGDLWVPITAHALNNALAFGLLLASQS